MAQYISFKIQAVGDVLLTLLDIICQWSSLAHYSNIFEDEKISAC